MTDLHDASLANFIEVDNERRESERSNGVPKSYSEWPRDLLVRWRHALAQLRLVRSVTRHQGQQPPALPTGLSWIDDREFKLIVDDDTDATFYWLQTPEETPD